MTSRTTHEARRLFRRSACARAVASILSDLARCGLGGFTVGQLARVLSGRFARSTVAHAVVSLRRLGAVVPAGRWRRAARWMNRTQRAG
jgi:hypothetical protein